VNHDTPSIAVVKVLGTWFLVGVSQMSPLQVVQLIAAGMAAIYTALQIVIIVRGWWSKRKANDAHD
jgi:hypothetical protein